MIINKEKESKIHAVSKKTQKQCKQTAGGVKRLKEFLVFLV